MKKLHIILAFLAVITLFSCETDIEINAPYKDIAVVYGLIDPAVDTQYVKINKAFLGDNAYDLAQDASNFNYPDGELDVVVKEINSSGNVANTYYLTRTVNEVPKDAGTFDNSQNVLFRFIEPNITPGGRYKLTIVNKVLNKEITSEMLIVKNSSLGIPGNMNAKFNFWGGVPANGNYLNKPFRLTTGGNIGRVEAVLVFNYKEFYTDGSFEYKTVKMTMGEAVGETPSEGKFLEWEMDGGVFFTNITNSVPVSVPLLDYRMLVNISLEFNVAGTELSTYMAASSPSTSVNQERPTYTNINNGLGIFSSRTVLEMKSSFPEGGIQINIGVDTLKKLNSLGLGFCSDANGIPQC